MKIKDEALELMTIESSLYEYYQKGNNEMYQFLLSIEKEKLKNITPDRAFKILNHLAIKNKLVNENSSSIVLLLNDKKQNIPLKRLFNRLEKVLITDDELFNLNYEKYATDDFKNYFLCNDYLVANGYDISVNRLLDLDMTEVLISRLNKHNDEKSKAIIKDLFYLYPDLEDDRHILTKTNNIIPIANRFDITTDSLSFTLRRDLLFTLSYMHIFDEAEVISYSSYNDNFKYMNDYIYSNLSIIEPDQVDAIIDITIQSLIEENKHEKNETNSFNYAKDVLSSHYLRSDKLQKTLYKG